MVARNKKPDIPDTFPSIEAAGAYWDTHSLADFDHQIKEAPMEIDFKKRIRYISVSEEIYRKIAIRAQEQKRTVRELVYALGEDRR